MPVTDKKIEAEIQDKGLTALRVTPADIEANIASEHYFTAGNGIYGAGADSMASNSGVLGEEFKSAFPASLELLTFCVLVLRNGTKIVGINYWAIDSNQHSAERGRAEARAHAVEQIWPLMGYELRSKIAAV